MDEWCWCLLEYFDAENLVRHEITPAEKFSPLLGNFLCCHYALGFLGLMCQRWVAVWVGILFWKICVLSGYTLEWIRGRWRMQDCCVFVLNDRFYCEVKVEWVSWLKILHMKGFEVLLLWVLARGSQEHRCIEVVYLYWYILNCLFMLGLVSGAEIWSTTEVQAFCQPMRCARKSWNWESEGSWCQVWSSCHYQHGEIGASWRWRAHT